MPHTTLPPHARVVVVGTGFSGVAAAVALQRAGEDDVVLLEQADEVGGTWRDNAYPGCACDVPSHLYQLSYAPNPGWGHAFARQPEIQRYLVDVATRLGVRDRVRFGTALERAAWDAAAGVWRVETSRGAMTAEVLVTATGALSEPAVPDLPGLGSFAGPSFHSARWDHDVELDGRRLAVVGTGASAVQFVPHVQRRAAALTVFQRTPAWVLPRRDRRIPAIERALYRRFPGLQRLLRERTYWTRESWVLGFSGRTGIMRAAQVMARRHLARQVRDPALRAVLTPDFRIGCKRVLLSNDWYPALVAPTTTVVPERVVEVRPHGVVSEAADGTRTEHPADVLVWGTGFHVTDQPIASRVVGTDGRTLAGHWSGTGMQAHLGLTVAGFPNLFVMMGPNTGQGHTSVILFAEAQARYLAGLVRATRGSGAVEPRKDVQDRWNADLQRRLAPTVWNSGGCRSWYLDDHGRNTVLWPSFAESYRRRLAEVDLSDYLLHPVPTGARSGAPGAEAAYATTGDRS